MVEEQVQFEVFCWALQPSEEFEISKAYPNSRFQNDGRVRTFALAVAVAYL